MDYFFKKISILFLFVTLFNSQLNAQCPDGATITANTKCVFLSWVTPPNPLPASITYQSVTYTFQNLGNGTSANPAIYRDSAPGGGACNSNQSSVLTGQILIPEPCNYVDGNLPLNLLSFEGMQISNINYLKWQTTFENNTDFFEIEKSLEGTKFEKIGVVKTHNNNSSEINKYSFSDALASNKVNYYRLKIVDLDGSFEKSKIIAVDGNSEISYNKTYPNPVSNTFILEVENEGLVGTNVELLEMNGKMINKFMILGKTMPLELKDISNGIYILKFFDGSFTKIIKN